MSNNISKNALKVLETRYFAKDNKGNVVENVDTFFERIARSIANADPDVAGRAELFQKYLTMLKEMKFLPNTPTLINAGRPLGQLSACFVLPVGDSMGEIFDAVKATALIHQTGGGTGFSFSRLRENGAIVKSTGGRSSGPVSFMKVINASTDSIKQNGLRRGANMGILRVDHPDILEFIDCKTDLSQLTNFNISVAITDAFMKAVVEGTDYYLVSPQNCEVVKRLSAREVFDKICQNAWKTGEPGLFFIDTANKFNPTPSKWSYEATNPCLLEGTPVLTPNGERPVETIKPGDLIVCVDGVSRPVQSIETHENMPVFEVAFSSGITCAPPIVLFATASHQFYRWENGAHVRVDCLKPGDLVQQFGWCEVDSEIVSTNSPIRVLSIKPAGTGTVYDLFEPVTDTWITKSIVNRGCGEQVLGPNENCTLASINLEKHVVDGMIDWDSLYETTSTATQFLDNVVDANKFPIPQLAEINKGTRRIGLGIMGFARMLMMLEIPYDSDEGLAMAEKVMAFIKDVANSVSVERGKKYGVYPYFEGIGPARRNSHILTIAPTGTISMIADTSSGCEPEFALVWYKNVMDGQHLPYALPLFESSAKREGWWTDDLLQKVIDNHGSCKGLPGVPERWQRVFVTAHDITPEWHVKMQAAFQKHIDAAVSKTINMPTTATVDDVKNAYVLAYQLGCKGITVYRDGSRQNQVLNVGKTDKNVSSSKIDNSLANDVLPWGTRKKPQGVIVGGRLPVKSHHGKVYVHLYVDDDGIPQEIFVTPATAHEEKESAILLGRLGSLALQYGAPFREIVGQFIKAHEEAGTMGSDVHMTVKALGQLYEDLSARAGKKPDVVEALKCPECRVGRLSFQEGCQKCTTCGFSKC